MSRKTKKTLVLSIGFSLIAMIAVALIVYMIFELKREPEPFWQRFLVRVVLFLFLFPIILEGLTLLRSIYILLFFHPRTAAKVCYIISGILVFAALVFQALFLSGVYRERSDFLLFSWPIILVSSLLGSVPCGAKENRAP